MQKQQFAIACLSALIFLTSSSLVAGQGSCPRMPRLPTFNTKSFTGHWWMYAVHPASRPVANSLCRQLAYTYVNNNVLNVTEFGVNGYTESPDHGTATQGAPAHFTVRLARAQGVREYDIIDIVYDNYYVEYNCQTVETIIVYTRSPNPSQSVIDNGLKKFKLSLKDFRVMDLKKC